MPFGLKDGALDPAQLDEDKKKLADFATATMEAWHGRKVSPVYQLLPNLQPPDWKTLRVGDINAFWDSQQKWESRVRTAQRAGRAGDVLVFAGEAPTRVLELEARLAAGAALKNLGQFKFALEQYQKALDIEPDHLEARRMKGLLLGRLQRYPEADVWLRDAAHDHPSDAETLGLLGRVEKDAWLSRWRKKDSPPARMREEAAVDAAMLKRAIGTYTAGFRLQPGNYYPGINALTLSCLLEHLSGIKMKRGERDALEGGVRWAVDCVLSRQPNDYWARVTLGDMALLDSPVKRVEETYRAAVAVADNDWFALDSSRQQIKLMRDLEFRPAESEAAEKIFERALAAIPAPEAQIPRQVFLFSGHMIDKSDRPKPRFPAGKEGVAAAAIAAKLEELGGGPEDLAFCR